MARWTRALCCGVVPTNVVVVTIILFAIPHQPAVILLYSWLYGFPVVCILLLIVTGSFQKDFVHVPKLVAFSVLAMLMSFANIPIYLFFTFWDNLGPM